ncbi:GntR family transcriptional regulator [Pedobacter nyackensis]|uniref:GntR family transcriptional regulator n=1 Tax=Pedobacter nyackensis TaxID=475255 RepID=UPI00292FB90E|nr:GntR family transcriptional regulator [Pedobacter nyackensis]
MHRFNAETWTFPQSPGAPLNSDQVYQIIVKYIENGTILPGSKLPPYRSVAELNDISRTTMSRIYKRLENNGWVVPVKGSGTYVSQSFPGYAFLYPLDRSIERLPIRLGNASGAEMHNDHPPSDFIMIGFETPSPHHLSQWLHHTQIAKHAQAYVNFKQMDRINAMTNVEFNAAILNYMNVSRNFMVKGDCLGVVLGRIESLQQIFKLLLNPLDKVVNTSPRDLMLRKLLKDCAAVSHHISSSNPGFIKELKKLLRHTTIKALYIKPQCSHLESYSMSENDCIELLELARKHQFYIIEEDDYHELWYEMKPFKPLICRNHAGHVIYCGALSLLTIYMQQTRIIVAPAEFISMMHRTRMYQSPFECTSTKHAITLMLNDNRLLTDIKKMQKEKKQHMFEAGMQLINAFGKAVNVVKPSAGLCYWLEFPDAKYLRDAILHLQSNNLKIPFHPGMNKPTFEERYVCFGFGTWDVMEVELPAKLMFEKLSSKYGLLQ